MLLLRVEQAVLGGVQAEPRGGRVEVVEVLVVLVVVLLLLLLQELEAQRVTQRHNLLPVF